MDRVRKMLFNKAPQLEEFEIGDALREVLDIFAYDTGSKAIAIVLDPPTDPIFVRAARLELQQVVMNLVLNSVQAITAADSPCKRVDLAWWKDGMSVVVQIEDTGPGLSDITARDIFNPFVSSKESGMGIGLAVSRRIVERHHGRIDLSASGTGGARFQVTMPIVEQGHAVVSA
jgi:C4-dicarboxylate-specific signal transduction histidine kinase